MWCGVLFLFSLNIFFASPSRFPLPVHSTSTAIRWWRALLCESTSKQIWLIRPLIPNSSTAVPASACMVWLAMEVQPFPAPFGMASKVAGKRPVQTSKRQVENICFVSIRWKSHLLSLLARWPLFLLLCTMHLCLIHSFVRDIYIMMMIIVIIVIVFVCVRRCA